MSTPRFANRYRIPSVRMRGWDYTSTGQYFVTICTFEKMPWLGNIRGGRVRLSDIGTTVNACWHAIPRHHPHVALDAFVVMPDHIHGIVVIGKRDAIHDTLNNESVETRHVASLPTASPSTSPTASPSASPSASPTASPTTFPRTFRPNVFGPLRSGSLQSIIHSFKAAVTRQCRQMGKMEFHWQPRYHDHCIRTPRELSAIRRYIRRNPAAWFAKHVDM